MPTSVITARHPLGRSRRIDDRRFHLLRHAAVPALVRDPVARRVQRQSVQAGDGPVRRLQLYSNPAKESQFSAIATALFILPFFLLSALSGQLADDHDKARLIRIIKFAEIGIMIARRLPGSCFANMPLMLAALFAMGVHSTFFGPIKYAILPQHLHKDEVLGGTGLVEAGTYIAILGGTMLAGVLAARPGRRRSP